MLEDVLAQLTHDSHACTLHPLLGICRPNLHHSPGVSAQDEGLFERLVRNANDDIFCRHHPVSHELLVVGRCESDHMVFPPNAEVYVEHPLRGLCSLLLRGHLSSTLLPTTLSLLGRGWLGTWHALAHLASVVTDDTLYYNLLQGEQVGRKKTRKPQDLLPVSVSFNRTVQYNHLLYTHILEQRVRLGAKPERWDRPTMKNTEEMFLLHGPVLFEWMMEQFPKVSTVERVASVSRATLSRWQHTEVGKTFGQGRTSSRMRSYHPIWFGYPGPFPGMDRICEEVFGLESSFLGVLIDRMGIRGTIRYLRNRMGFGLDALELDSSTLHGAGRQIGIPTATLNRWMSGRSYPSQWYALDAMANHCLGMHWLDAVIYVRPRNTRRETPHDALRCMLEQLDF